MSAETRRKRAEVARENCRKRKERGGYEKSKKKLWKPVVCLTDGKEFPSIGHAAEHYGIPRHHISGAIHRVGTTRGLRIRLKSQLENIREVI